MAERPHRRRQGGSLVFPIILIVLGALFLLDNLNVISGVDWETIWKLWPILLIALGLEVVLGRRLSCGALILVLLIVVIGGAAVWWSVASRDGERTTEQLIWPKDGIERAELELNLGIGELRLDGASDMGELMIADLDLARGAEVSHNSDTMGTGDDVVRAWLRSDGDFFSFPRILDSRASEWDVQLNDSVRWEMDLKFGLADAHLDLSDLQVSELTLDRGVGSVDVTLPERGMVRATIDGGLGDITVTIPTGVEARLRVDRGIGGLDVSSRFRRRGDIYETEGLSGAESYIDLTLDVGVGSATVR